MNAEILPTISAFDDLPPLVKPGIYELAFVDYRTANMFMGKAPKIVMTFRIVSMGKFHGFMREYMTLFTGRVSRLDRIPMSLFENVLIEGRVSTVTRAQGRDIPKELQYSTISELKRVV